MTEAQFQTKVIKKIKRMFPGVVVVKNDAQYIQGFPDWSFFWGPHWATLEFKQNKNSRKQPNQEHYVKKLNEMSFAAIIHPENEEEVLFAMEQAFAA